MIHIATCRKFDTISNSNACMICSRVCACMRTRVQVTDDHIQLGTIEFDTGFVNVVAVYRAICFRPFVNEVLDAAVSHVTELGFFAEVGPLEVFVSRLVSKDSPWAVYLVAARLSFLFCFVLFSGREKLAFGLLWCGFVFLFTLVCFGLLWVCFALV